MPFPNQHAARQASSAGSLRCRTSVDKGGPGIDFIFCIRRSDNQSYLASVRFDAKRYSPEQARAWLERHGMKTNLEPARA